MIAVVLGGNGFIGSTLVSRLLAQGHSVRVFDRGAPMHSSKSFHFFAGDFTTHADFTELLHGADVVFHLISTTLPNTSVDNTSADVCGNLLPTLRLLEQMRKQGISRIVFPSSGGTVYGEAQYLPIDEKHPTEPIVPYGATKLAIEKYLAIFRHARQLDPICLRISNPYGPGFRPESPQGVIGAFLNKSLSNQPIDLWGAGEVQRDYLYIDDLIDAMIAAAYYEGPHFLFNISTGIGTSLLQIIALVEQATGHPLVVHRHSSRSFDVRSNVLCNARAREELGWSPKLSLTQGIERTLQWLKAARKYNHSQASNR